MNLNSDVRIARAADVFTAATGVILLDQGWSAQTGPGRPVLLVRGLESLDVSGMVHGLANETVAAEAWKAQRAALRIAGRALGVAPNGEDKMGGYGNHSRSTMLSQLPSSSTCVAQPH